MITNTQRIRIYPGKLEFRFRTLNTAKVLETNKLFLQLGIYPDYSVCTSANTERVKICSVTVVHLPG